MKAAIAVIPGDGIGKEVVPQGVKALRAVEKRFHHEFDLREAALGFETWKTTGKALPRETMQICQSSQGILLGATGAAQWEHAAENIPPGWGRRQLCRELDYCASVWPARVYPQLLDATPVKPEHIQGMDTVVVREMRWINKKHPKTTRHTPQGWYAADKLSFREDEILPILRFSFLLAQSRRKKLVLMSQTSIFQTSALWLKLFTEMGQQFPDIKIDAMAPDNCAMQLVRQPSQFDVIVCDNTSMGGILNELAGLLQGFYGLADVFLRHVHCLDYPEATPFDRHGFLSFLGTNSPVVFVVFATRTSQFERRVSARLLPNTPEQAFGRVPLPARFLARHRRLY